MGAKLLAMFLVCMFCMLNAVPFAYAWQQNCPPSYPPYHRPSPPSTPQARPPSTPRPRPPSTPQPHPPAHQLPPSVPRPPSLPQHGGGTPPPGIIPPITTPPVTRPPPSSSYLPYTPPGGGGGTPPSISPPPAATCPIDTFKLGFCLDVLGGLVHVVIGNPVENLCCPVIQGLLEQEAAMCLCTTIRLKFLNLNIFLPLAFQVLTTCGLTPPPDFVCPPL